jgi:hypothetical protein
MGPPSETSPACDRLVMFTIMGSGGQSGGGGKMSCVVNRPWWLTVKVLFSEEQK